MKLLQCISAVKMNHKIKDTCIYNINQKAIERYNRKYMTLSEFILAETVMQNGKKIVQKAAIMFTDYRK